MVTDWWGSGPSADLADGGAERAGGAGNVAAWGNAITGPGGDVSRLCTRRKTGTAMAAMINMKVSRRAMSAR